MFKFSSMIDRIKTFSDNAKMYKQNIQGTVFSRVYVLYLRKQNQLFKSKRA